MRQEAFQYHPTLWIRHEVPCFVMSQSIQQQQGKVLTEQQHVQGACSGQGGGDGVKPHLCVFQSLVMLSPGSCRAHPVWPSGHCWGTGPLCSCFQLPAPAQAWPSSAPHGHCSPHHSLCQPEHRGQKASWPLHRLVLQKPALTRSTQSQVFLGQREQDFWQY